MRDDWYGHRDPFSGLPRGDRDEWTSWDHALADAVQTIEDYSDEYGLLPWILDDDEVEVRADKKHHPFKSAIDRKTKGTEKKPYKPEPGEYFVPKVISRREDGSKQTMREWFDKKAEEASAVE